MLQTAQADFLFADARTLYDDALEMLDQGRLRNAAEKAWGATKRATDGLILARTGKEPEPPARPFGSFNNFAGKTRPLSRCDCNMATANPSSKPPASTTAFSIPPRPSSKTCAKP